MKKVNGSIAILGSGETSPNLVSVHRKLLNKIGDDVSASLIDTPFGFQENADQLVDKLIEFYDVSLNIDTVFVDLLVDLHNNNKNTS